MAPQVERQDPVSVTQIGNLRRPAFHGEALRMRQGYDRVAIKPLEGEIVADAVENDLGHGRSSFRNDPVRA